MRRSAEKDLKIWFEHSDRAPLILRGARQVGKSTLVRIFCESQNLELLEVNLEKEKIKSIQAENISIQNILDEIQFITKKTISEKTLIFLDEIQEQPRLLSALRYFYEEYPKVAVIAAGSLLEIALKAEKFSFPVGRVEFYHLSPMSFIEFLWATNNNLLSEKIQNLDFSPGLHRKAQEELRKYYYVGGMPKAVKTYVEEKSLVKVRGVQEQIIQTYMADFPKYNSRIQTERINRVFNAVSLQLGKKIIYQRIDPNSQSKDIRRILELLVDARVLLNCPHSDGNTVPLAGESDLTIQKLYLLDIGLMNCLMRLDTEAIDNEMTGNFNSKGVLAEQFVAQHLAYANCNRHSPELYYWLRDKGSQKGEIDFLIQSKQKIIPIEVKATKAGHLKSLFYFLKEKKKKLAIKVSLEEYSLEDIQHKIEGKVIEGRLMNLPLYAIDVVFEAVEKLISQNK